MCGQPGINGNGGPAEGKAEGLSIRDKRKAAPFERAAKFHLAPMAHYLRTFFGAILFAVGLSSASTRFKNRPSAQFPHRCRIARSGTFRTRALREH